MILQASDVRVTIGGVPILHGADLVQVRIEDGVPIVRTVWRQGRRVL